MTFRVFEAGEPTNDGRWKERSRAGQSTRFLTRRRKPPQLVLLQLGAAHHNGVRHCPALFITDIGNVKRSYIYGFFAGQALSAIFCGVFWIRSRPEASFRLMMAKAKKRSALRFRRSQFTGESKDADMAPGGILSSGSLVRRGEGNGVVMLTGARTYVGRTSDLVQKARPKLHIDAVMAKVVRWLFLVVGALSGLAVVMSLVRGTALIEMVPLMLILLISAIPLSLPIMFTVSIAVESKELAKRGVLITRLSATEDAATMDVLCVDKTGTVTMNQLAVTMGSKRRPGGAPGFRCSLRLLIPHPGQSLTSFAQSSP